MWLFARASFIVDSLFTIVNMSHWESGKQHDVVIKSETISWGGGGGGGAQSILWNI